LTKEVFLPVPKPLLSQIEPGAGATDPNPKKKLIHKNKTRCRCRHLSKVWHDVVGKE
jgi:hypothetical protein